MQRFTCYSIQALNARWCLFGHITLRLREDASARLAMSYYFVKDHKGRQRNYMTIASKLSSELKVVMGDEILCQRDFDLITEVAQHRDLWKDLVNDITCRHHEIWLEKEAKKSEPWKAPLNNKIISSLNHV